jgi:hypothetical protein
MSDAAGPRSEVAYENTAERVWADRARALYEQRRVQVAAFETEGVVSAQVWGPCPRCGHDLDVQLTLNTPIPGMRGPRSKSIPPTVEVGCGCGHSHPGAPEKVLGCGVSFRIPTVPPTNPPSGPPTPGAPASRPGAQEPQ